MGFGNDPAAAGRGRDPSRAWSRSRQVAAGRRLFPAIPDFVFPLRPWPT
jgi:hypothetical protein